MEAGRGLRVYSSQLRGDSGRGAAAVEGRFGGRWGSSVVEPLSRRAALRSGPRANVYGGAAWAAALPPTNKDEQLGDELRGGGVRGIASVMGVRGSVSIPEGGVV